MISGRLLTRNAIYSILGQVLPLVAAFAAIRFLIDGLGEVRFGVLMIAWAAAGYFAIFDFGLARAMTHAVAARLGGKRESDGGGDADRRDADSEPASSGQVDLGEIVWSAMGAMFALGIAGMLLVALATPALVRLIGVPEEYRVESLRSFYLIALSIPWMVSTGGLRGLLEAHQRFGMVTLLRIPLALTAFVGPLILLRYTSRLEPIVLLLVGGRILVWALYLLVCLRDYPFLRRVSRMRWQVIRPLAHFGGWTTMANVIGQLMTHLDRFAVAALLTVSAATYYVPPFEIATKLWIIPVGVTAVLFPSFTWMFANDRSRTADLVDSGLRALLVFLFPLTLILVAFAPEILGAWLGAGEGVTRGVPVLRWLCAGAFTVGIGYVLSCAIQGIGRPDLIAKMQLAELPLYWLGLWWFTGRYGLAGVAIASASRMLLDTAILHVLVPKMVASTGAAVARSAARMAPLLAALALVAHPDGFMARSALAAGVLAVFAAYTWIFLIRSDERSMLARSVGLSVGASRVPAGP